MGTPVTPRHYIRYSDDLEVLQPDEVDDARAVTESMARVNAIMFERYRHAVRDAHAKSHGVLRGELEIRSGLPSHLAQGLFATPRRYPVVIRLSTAQGTIDPDTQSALRGFALKVIGVEGAKLLPGERDEVTQDFLLVNYPVIPTGTVKQYLSLQQQIEQHVTTPTVVSSVANAALIAGRKIKSVLGQEEEPNRIGSPGSHLLGDSYFSMAALRFGDYVAKIRLAPESQNVVALHGQPMDADLIKQQPDTFLTTIVRRFFASESAVYELSAQLCTDVETMPIEDGSVQWPEEESPYQPLATLTIRPQNSFSPARRMFADDVLSFNPFHCLPAHRPLGNIMRVRRLVYERSSRYRHEMNAQPRREPRSIDELPD